MRRLTRAVAVAAAAIVSAGCDTTAAPSSQAPAVSAPTGTPPTTPAFTTDSIPTLDAPADRGCVDQAGTLHAHATDWYPGSTGSPLALTGERSTSALLDEFVAAATEAVTSLAPEFVLTDRWENRRTASSCVTHRYAVYARGDDKLVISTWRLDSAADPFWIPNEAAFSALDDATLVSPGDHIATALVVAPDGTTARATAYGARAADMVAGWPSTTMSIPSAEPPGPTPITARDLVPLAGQLLAGVLSQR